MPNLRDRILDYLKNHSEGADDDQLADALKLKQRQQANSRCRQLSQEGLIDRTRVNGKIRNFAIDGPERPIADEPAPPAERPWSWEGNVQNTVVGYLRERGYSITRVANTATREQGKDIEARKGTKNHWVTVKGYPEGTPRTQPSTQAGHWFKQALFDAIAWRGEDQEVEIALAFPDFPRYHKLAMKVQWIQPVARFSFYWVGSDATVTREPAA